MIINQKINSNYSLVPDGTEKKIIVLDKALPPLEMNLFDKKMWACSKAVKVLFTARDIKNFELDFYYIIMMIREKII